MSREILFKGKRIDNGEWVEGYLFGDGIIGSNRMFIGELTIEDYKGNADDGPTIITGSYYSEVDPETVCQYTNKSDDNDVPICEEDFVKINDDWIGRVIWSERDTAFCVFPNDDIEYETYCLGYYISEGYQIEAIGNIFDNPELLKAGQQSESPIT